MPRPAALILSLVLLTLRLCAQESQTDPRGNTVVDCGPDKVVILANSESPDGQYALGWTVRPDQNKTPVDWSAYDGKNVSDWLGKYLTGDDPASGAYAVVNGVLDLHAGKFTPLATREPFWSGKNHADFGVAWSGNANGTRYAIVNNDGRWSTTNLWLVEISPGGVHALDLAPTAGKAVAAALRKHSRKSYETTFTAAGGNGKGKPATDPFEGGKLKVGFDSEIPKSEDPGYQGSVTVAIPRGTVVGVAARRSTP